MLKKTISRLSKLSLARDIRDDDFIDQLHHYVMVGFLTVIALAVGGKQFVGKPIHCWLPAEYNEDEFQDYADNMCWVSRMYNVHFDDELPVNEVDRHVSDIGYYRWAVVIFLLQALLFALPHIVWLTLKDFAVINIKGIVSMCVSTQLNPEDSREQTLEDIASFIHRSLGVPPRRPTGIYRLCNILSTRSKNYLTVLYMLTKSLYLTNVIFQFYLLSLLLDFNYWSYGVNVVNYFTEDTFWNDLDNFPRVGMCDFKIRQLQNVLTFTVQCVLSINLFLEKIFAFQWFAFACLAVVTGWSFTSWLIRHVFPWQRESFLKPYVHVINSERAKNEKEPLNPLEFDIFVRDYLGNDGLFLLRVIGNNTNAILAADLLRHIWNCYERSHSSSKVQH